MPDKTKIQTEIDLFAALERGEPVAQSALSKHLSVSVGLVNALMKRVIKKGYVKARAVPYRRWAYYLTPTGFAEKSRLVARYLETSLDFFRRARGQYLELFQRARACGVHHIVLVGRGELAEIAQLAARDAGIEILGLLDHEVNADEMYGLPILRDLDGVDVAASLVITESRHPQDTFDRISHRYGDRQVLVPELLHVSQPMAEDRDAGTGPGGER